MNLISVIEAILGLLLLVYVMLMWLPAFLTLRPDYKYYKKTYLALYSKTYVVKNDDMNYLTFSHKSGKDHNEIIYFGCLNGDIKLIEGYIHKDQTMFWVDPYTMYWYYKIRKQIMINSSVENSRDNTLRKLGI